MASKKFVATKRVQWATKAQVNTFVDELTSAWEAKGLTEKTVLERAQAVIDDAKAGELTLDGKNIYVLTLTIALANAGVDVIDSSKKSTPDASAKAAASKYA